MLKEAFQVGSLPFDLQQADIVMVPNLEALSDDGGSYRPISLINPLCADDEVAQSLAGTLLCP